MSRRDFHGRVDQRRAAAKRLADAERLLGRAGTAGWREQRGNHSRGAMYLAGYAVECKIKACMMEMYDCMTLAELTAKIEVNEAIIYQHGLEALLSLRPGWLAMLKRSDLGREFLGSLTAGNRVGDMILRMH